MSTLVGVSSALQGRSCFGRVPIWAEISYWVLQGEGGSYFGESLVLVKTAHYGVGLDLLGGSGAGTD